MDPFCFQSLIFTCWPCQCYLEACLWYSDFQQEHLKPNAKCFLLNYPNTNQIWISVRNDGWNLFPRVITMVFMWPGKVMSCLAPLAGGPIVIVSFLARLVILPWANCKTYSISCSWWILFDSKVWSSPVDYVNAISRHVYGTPIFNRNIWSPMLNVSCSIIQTPLHG